MTRRNFLDHTSRRALLVSALALAQTRGLPLVGAAHAQTATAPNAADLLNAGPLPDRVLGPATATVTIVEYSSMTCSHCAEYADTTFADLKKQFIDTGKVRYMARPFPLDALAAAAAMLIYSVDPGNYYAALDTLFRQQQQWISDRIQPLMTFAVSQLGFTEQKFIACLADKQLFDNLAAEHENGRKLGITSTPSFFINGDKSEGYKTIQEMADLINSHLKA